MDQIEKFLNKLGKNDRAQLSAILKGLQVDSLPRNLDIKPLKGMKNYYRIRKGKIRIIYYKEKNVVGIVKIDFRKDVY